ncbi:sensor histidine kinase [Nocardiopsis sp. N85]|uniref:sensor histidine kinase n=1 Tax=Nocardiopsis sp. N85 TaxID=3029400 RepID=UPI00237EF9F9|nr:sensor histidine kinase [Nocardiopsis sp. N85]MDE3723315.1 sensor histidine kinase [Nocardiopsis sp. N85]
MSEAAVTGRGDAPPGRAVPWVSAVVYGVVGFAGLYYAIADLGGDGPVAPVRVVGFTACVALLFALEFVERRLFPVRTPTGPAIAFFAVRPTLFVAVAALDPSGLSRVLFVLVPFSAYLAFGRAASLTLGALCLLLLLGGHALWVPGWYTDATYVSDVLMFSVGLVLAIAMAGIAVREQQGRRRLEEALGDLEESHARLTAYADQVAELSATAERNRMARDIHDGLGHHLTAIAVQLEKAAEFRDRDPAAAGQALADARGSARRALEDVRHSVRALRGGEAGFRIRPALADLVRHADRGRPAVTLSVVGEEDGFGEAALTTLYRACQEALTNARRHAGAGLVSVTVVFDAVEARLVVQDDGVGPPTAPPDLLTRSPGVGLAGMRERAALVGGRVDLHGVPGEGTRVTVTVPRGDVRPCADVGVRERIGAPGASVDDGQQG